jgi:hypothetical protein
MALSFAVGLDCLFSRCNLINYNLQLVIFKDPLGEWHQRHMSCGHPTFMYRLPLDAQNKIREIWAHYEAGDECDKEKDATRQVNS